MRALSSLAYRARWARLGVFYLKSPKIDRLQVGEHSVRLLLPETERSVQEHEFHRIAIEDCYRLAKISRPVRTVLDVGANIGLFAIAARHHFPEAAIHCYEPNPALASFILPHCKAVNATYYAEAIGAKSGSVSLNSRGNSLHSTISSVGFIRQTAFCDATARLGEIDLLKLDCEGAEWDLFSVTEPWQQVRHLTMEYHLWANPGATVETLFAKLEALGFHRINIEPKNSFGLAFACK